MTYTEVDLAKAKIAVLRLVRESEGVSIVECIDMICGLPATAVLLAAQILIEGGQVVVDREMKLCVPK